MSTPTNLVTTPMLDRSAEILALLQQGRLSPALARLKLWLKKAPGSAPAWHLLGVVQLHRNDYNAAADALHQVDIRDFEFVDQLPANQCSPDLVLLMDVLIYLPIQPACLTIR
jgi:tetratricopeptide (TPR) repeat protein